MYSLITDNSDLSVRNKYIELKNKEYQDKNAHLLLELEQKDNAIKYYFDKAQKLKQAYDNACRDRTNIRRQLTNSQNYANNLEVTLIEQAKKHIPVLLYAQAQWPDKDKLYTYKYETRDFVFLNKQLYDGAVECNPIVAAHAVEWKSLPKKKSKGNSSDNKPHL